MNFRVVDVPQRTEAWHQARLGRLTGSRAADMMARIKSGEAAARRDLRIQLVCERETGVPQDEGFVSKEMQRGIDRECDALAAYEAVTARVVRRAGFLEHPSLMAGCSLDGYVGDFVGIVELKCPKSATHLRYLRSGAVPSDHLPQIMHNLWISGAEWADFVSFDDRFRHGLQLFVCRVHRTDVDLDTYAIEAKTFLAEVDRECEAMATMANVSSQLQQSLAVA